MPHSRDPNAARGERTNADLTSLLVELGRALRGLSFYDEADAARGGLVDRAWLALDGEIRRAGPLELWRDDAGFRATGIRDCIPLDHIEDLGEALARHGVDRVAFYEELRRESLRAFLELLGRPAAAIRQCGGIARALASRCDAGIVVDGADTEENAPPAQRLGATPALPATPTLGSSLLTRTQGLVATATTGDPSQKKPSIDEAPLEARAPDETSERLLVRLIELDRCTDDEAYAFLGARVVEWARELFESGRKDECHRALLVLSGHAVGEGGRSGLQAKTAGRLSRELATGEPLAALLDRACSSDTTVGVRATQVLLQLGGHAIPDLFERLFASDPVSETRAQLTAAMIAVGESSVPFVGHLIRDPDDARSVLAIQLAGELQNRALVPALVAALEGDREGLRREAARSLAHLGGDDAVHALVNALSSAREDLPEIAAHCLGALADPRGAQPLLAALERALRKQDDRRAREMIRALGQLGHERAVPKLVALLERRTILRRKALRELQLTALGALDRLPGREAHRAIERSTRHRDPAVRERASQLMASHADDAPDRDPRA